MKDLLNFVSYNRGVLFGVILGVILAIAAVSCTPEIASPLDSGKIVDATGLQLEYDIWQGQNAIMEKKFTFAVDDLQRQAENRAVILKTINDLASASPTSWPMLILQGGGIGAIADNIRKRGVIAGLKRNKA